MSGYPRGNPEHARRRWDRVFEALAAEPRRRLVDALASVPQDESVTLPGAAGAPDGQDDPRHLRVELCHQHLPLLADAGYVDWERQPFRATRGPQFAEIEGVLESLDRHTASLPAQLVAERTRDPDLERKSESESEPESERESRL